jgi:hypothetical protein
MGDVNKTRRSQMRIGLGNQLRRAGLRLMCAVIVTTTGCISSDCTVSYGPKGPPVEKSTLRRIKCGQTSKRWVLATLGDPTAQNPTPDGGEMLRYEYCKRVKSDFAMCPPPLSFEKDKEYHTTVLFEIRDGVVIKYWKEN